MLIVIYEFADTSFFGSRQRNYITQVEPKEAGQLMYSGFGELVHSIVFTG